MAVSLTNSRATAWASVAILISATLLTGCDKIKHLIEKPSDCSEAAALSAVESQFEKGVLSATKPYLSNDAQISSDTLRAMLAQIKTEVDDIRTQSEKQSCIATLKLNLNSELINRADTVRVAQGEKSIKDVAFAQDINFDGNTISQEFEYRLQPTDDGKKMVATLENVRNLQNFLARVMIDASQKPPTNLEPVTLASVVASTVVVSAPAQPVASTPTPTTQKPEAPKTPTEPPSDNQDEADSVAPNADTSQLTDAKAIVATEQAQARLAIKRKQFNDMWNSASPEAQESLTEDQKNWVEERDATCTSEAESAKTGFEEATRMQCMSRMLSERYVEVKDYFDNYE